MELPTQKQIDFAKQIISTLNLEVENKIFHDRQKISNFIKQNKVAYYQAEKNNVNDIRRKFIIENLSLLKMIELLDYKEIKDKSCKRYPVYDTDIEEGIDRVVCEFRVPEKDSNIEKNFYTFFMPKNTSEPSQLKINGLQKAKERRKYVESKYGGGTVIDFVLKRTLDYSYNDIIEMLIDIAKDDNNMAKYGFDISKISNKKYNVTTQEVEEDDSKKWKNSYEKIKEISTEEKKEKTARILNFYDDITNILPPVSNRIKISRIRAQYDEFFGAIIHRNFDKTKKKLISEDILTPPNNSLFEISCPIYFIRENRNNGDIWLDIVGDQRINVLSDDFFDNVRKNIELTKRKNGDFFIHEVNINAQDAIKLVEKLSKMEIPQDLKTKEGIITMAKMLIVRNHQTKETEFITDQKKTRFGTRRAVGVFGIPTKENDTNRTMLIVENPILDGFSAIKLGYFDKNKTAVFGTIGHPSKDFYESMQNFIFARHKHYNNIAIATDNDEAGEKFYKEMKQNFFEIYKKLFAKVVEPEEVLREIHSFDDLKFHANNILNQNMLKKWPEFIPLMQSIADIDVTRSKPNGNFKDFNEELIEKNKMSENLNNNNNINYVPPKM